MWPTNKVVLPAFAPIIYSKSIKKTSDSPSWHRIRDIALALCASDPDDLRHPLCPRACQEGFLACINQECRARRDPLASPGWHQNRDLTYTPQCSIFECYDPKCYDLSQERILKDADGEPQCQVGEPGVHSSPTLGCCIVAVLAACAMDSNCWVHCVPFVSQVYFLNQHKKKMIRTSAWRCLCFQV